MTSKSSANRAEPRTVRGFAIPLIRRIVEACPRRLAGTDSERRAHDILADELRALGLEPSWHSFRYNQSLYAHMALHFSVATVATALLFVWPWLAFGLHLLAAISYWGDSTRRFMLLRRLFRFVDSRNLLVTLPATGSLRRRIVVIAHVDAAFTGVIFHPKLIKMGTQEPPIKALRFLRKSMLLATGATALLAGVDLLVAAYGMSAPLLWLALLLTIPPLLTALANIDVVLRDEVVPGANDNLTGSASVVMLAERLRDQKPDDVELVFVVSGCEEAGTGGAWALARDYRERWSTEDTVVLGVDTLSGGQLRWYRDGEIMTRQVAPEIEGLLESVRAGDRRYVDACGFDIPSGATDALPFLALGYAGVSIGCVDPDIGAPRNYHYPSDTPDNLDPAQYEISVDYCTEVLRGLMAPS